MLDCVEVLGCVGSANGSSVLRVRGVKNEALGQSQAGISSGGVTFVPGRVELASLVMVSTFTPLSGPIRILLQRRLL